GRAMRVGHTHANGALAERLVRRLCAGRRARVGLERAVAVEIPRVVAHSTVAGRAGGAEADLLAEQRNLRSGGDDGLRGVVDGEVVRRGVGLAALVGVD